jgi:hypothetical protein
MTVMTASPRSRVPLRVALTAAAVPFLVPAAASAQEPVAGAEAAAAETDVERWAAQIDFGFNGSSGNTRLAVLSTGFQVRHLITDEFKLELSGVYRYGESERVVVARNMRAVMSGDFHPDERISPFFFGTLERDPFRRLDFRGDGGGGAKLTFHSSRTAEASFSSALLYSHERFVTRPDDVPIAPRTDARWSFRARARRRLSDGIRAEHTTFYQPVWDRFGDYNVDAVTRLTAQLNDRLAIGVTHTYRHDSTPPPDVLRADQQLEANVTIHF